ncbi:MAG: trypsin-like serine protease [Sphingomicrobium sp.]
MANAAAQQPIPKPPLPELPYTIETTVQNSGLATAGASPADTDQGVSKITVESIGREQFHANDGRESSAKGSALVSDLKVAPDNVRFTLSADAIARGGHDQKYASIGVAEIKSEGDDTAAHVKAVASATTVIHFRKDAPMGKYELAVRTSSLNDRPEVSLTEGSGGDAKKLELNGAPLQVQGGPNAIYFINASLPAEAQNQGGCCESRAVKAATVDVIFEPLPAVLEDTNTPLILNGSEVSPGQYEQVVAISFENALGRRLQCSGTVIAPRTILTAAHCIFNYQQNILKGQFSASVGKFETSPDEARMPIVSYDFPKSSTGGLNYDPENLEDDIGILYLRDPFAHVTTFPQLHRGAPSWQDLKNKQASLTIVGFGLMKDDQGHLTDAGVKRYVTIPFADYTNKAIVYSYTAAGGGACNGDSGGATFLTQARLLAGVTSSTTRHDCQGTGKQTRVDAYAAWLAPRLR